uniref:Uncharacterized protein n=1 Tax=Ciona savignyi TaxID=51511 RepID=H2YTS9_CIOSA
SKLAASSPWTALVITCKSKKQADAIQSQLDMRQKLGILAKDLLILCIEDPQEGLGSGGATLNALLVVTELLSAQRDYTVVTSDVLKDARILIMHFGRYFPYNPSGRGFISLSLVPENGEIDCLVTNFDALYRSVTSNLAFNAPPGLWVCSSDMLITFPQDYTINWDEVNVNDGAVCISVPSPARYASYHGVYKIGDQKKVQDLIFRGTPAQISACRLNENVDLVPLATGIVFFSTFATERLLTTHVTPPLDACTYMGIDSGMEPLCLSLFFDILLALATDVNEREFIKGNRSGAFGKENNSTERKDKQLMRNARSVLWKHLRDLPLTAIHIDVGMHYYLDMSKSPSEYCNILRMHCPEVKGFQSSHCVHSYVASNSKLGENVLLINSIVESGVTVGNNTMISHSHLTANTTVGKDCYIYGLDKSSCELISDSFISDATTLIGSFTSLENSRRVFVSLHILKPEIQNAEILPFSYRNVLAKASFNEHKSTLFMAKLIPVHHPNQKINILDSMVLLNDHISKSAYEKWLSSERYSFCEVLENVDHMKEFKYRMSLYFDVACKKTKEILLRNYNVSLLPFFKMFVANGQHMRMLKLLDNIAIEAVSGEVGMMRRPDISARAFACIADVMGYMAGAKSGLRSGPASNKHWKLPLSYLEQGKVEKGVNALASIRESWLSHPDQLTRAARHYEGAEQILIRHAVMSASTFVKMVPSVKMPSSTWYLAECPARIDISGGWTDTPPVCYEHGGAVVNAAILLDGKRPIGARIRKIKQPVILLTLLGEDDSSTQIIECSNKKDFSDYYQPQAPGALLKACFILAKVVDLDSEISLEKQLLSEFDGGFELQTWSMLPRGSGLGTSSILAGAVMNVVYRAAGYSVDNDSIIHSVLLVEQMLTTGGGWQDQVGGCLGGIKIGRSANTLPLHVTVEMLCIESYWRQKKMMATGCEPETCARMMEVLRPYSYGQALCGAGGGGFMYVLLKDVHSNEFIGNLLKSVEGAQDAVVYDVKIDRLGM